MDASLPFELEYVGEAWRGQWKAHRLRVVVAGPEAGPSPPHLATIVDVVDRWDDVKRTIAAYARSLAEHEHVSLEPSSIGGFAARNCGFDQEFGYFALVADHLDAPLRVEVLFDTGYPDGYAAYRAVLLGGIPTGITAFAT